jgi:hypothetical protein
MNNGEDGEENNGIYSVKNIESNIQKPGKRKFQLIKGDAILRVVGGKETSIAMQPKGQGKNEFGLTVKQERFAQAMASGIYSSQAAAYRTAYDCQNMSNESVVEVASRAMGNVAILARIRSVIGAKSQIESKTTEQIKQHVITRLQLESTDNKSSASARIRALELLGKLQGVQAFKETLDINTIEQDANTLTAQLERKLKALAGQ